MVRDAILSWQSVAGGSREQAAGEGGNGFPGKGAGCPSKRFFHAKNGRADKAEGAEDELPKPRRGPLGRVSPCGLA